MVTKLADSHKKMLVRESRIARNAIRAREYRTVCAKAELERLGFGRAQRNTPGLLIPIRGPGGDVVLYQYRPDEPRIKKGKPVKYETPTGSRMALDVRPFAREGLGDPSAPLFVTEGVKKGDALVSRGLCAVALIGVWNWRGANEHGGKIALPDWEQVALNGRRVYVIFDSDVMLKKEVHSALARLKAFLESRGAKVALAYLPPGEGGGKQGVDDFLASGREVGDLLALATNELRDPPRDAQPLNPYRATAGGLVWERPTPDGTVPVPLTNFTARIVADVVEDDGAETRRLFEVEALLNGHRITFTLPVARFASMEWPTEHLGAGAVIFPGLGIRDHARAAVQLVSGGVPMRHVFTHIGWKGGEDGWRYLHANGAIGPHGPVASTHVELKGVLGCYALPDPPEGDEARMVVRSSLGLLHLAPDEIIFPLLSAAYRAPLGSVDFSMHLSGATGAGKSELAALLAQHYGPELDARHLGSWESTENAIGGMAFAAKDAIMVVDDFAPTGTSYDVQRWHKKADRVLRSAGNRSGRSRMRPDTTLRSEKPPRCLILSTGEDVPRGQSLRARMLALEIEPGQLDFRRLTVCQREASAGVYARAMAAYLGWLAPRYADVRAGVKEEIGDLRDAARRYGGHRRTPEIVANLALGLRCLLTFALDVGAADREEAEGLWRRGWTALLAAAKEQSQHQVAQEPTRRFVELLSAAITGGRAHLSDPQGEHPEGPEAWGWRFSGEEWRPQGERVGWVDGERLYLEPEVAFAAAQRQGRDVGDCLALTGRTLNKRLHERGLLVSTDPPHLTVRRVLQGQRRRVLHLSAAVLYGQDQEMGQVGHRDRGGSAQAVGYPSLWSTSRRTALERGAGVGSEGVGHSASSEPVEREDADHEADIGTTAPEPAGPVGPVSREPPVREPREKGSPGDAGRTRPFRRKGRV